MTSPESVLAVQYLRVIAAQLEAMGVDVPAWLGLNGLTLEQLRASDFALDFAALRGLVLDAMRITEEPALAILVGRRLGVQAHGVLGHAVMSSGTLRETLTLFERFIALRIALVAMHVEPHPSEVRVRVVEQVPLGDVRAALMEALVCVIKTVLDDVSMGTCEIQRAAFSFAQPGHAAAARSLLGVPVAYGQGWDGLALAPEALDLRLRLSDPATFRLAEELCRRQLAELEAGRTWADRVRRLLLETRNGFPDQESVARRLHVSRRTLHRRLVAEGTSYRALLDDIRRRLAVEQLERGEASVEELAYVLGYADPANFRRAFRRWTGEAPSRYRARVRGAL